MPAGPPSQRQLDFLDKVLTRLGRRSETPASYSAAYDRIYRLSGIGGR